MEKRKKIFIVIPAYNEEKVIGEVIKDIKKEGYKNIIVVDDGSKDNTYKKAEEEKAIVLRHILNRGKGAAVKTGIEFAKNQNADIVVTIDGDGQNNPKEIKKLISQLDKGIEVVMGSRFQNKKNKMPLFNRFANFVANILIYLTYGIMVSDSQSGFRAYSKKAINSLNLQMDRYEFDSEVIREIVKNKLKYKELPIDVFYTEYSKSKKQKQNLINGIKTLIKIISS
jgi:glycosyltransferase involved in cell wall biosynthesis